MKHGPIMDRALRPEWLDTAFRFARSGKPLDEARSLLEIALRDEVENQVARGKTRTVLAHVWLDPPAAAEPLIRWAIDNASADEMPAWHLGALLATYPFFGSTCALIGREINLHGEVSTTPLRARVKARWGDRSTVDRGVARLVWTLRAFGVLTGSRGQALSKMGKPLPVDAQVFPWLVHALLLTRGIREIDAREVRKAPELFMFDLPSTLPDQFSLLERFNEGGDRVVLHARWPSRSGNVAEPPLQLTLAPNLATPQGSRRPVRPKR